MVLNYEYDAGVRVECGARVRREGARRDIRHQRVPLILRPSINTIPNLGSGALVAHEWRDFCGVAAGGRSRKLL